MTDKPYDMRKFMRVRELRSFLTGERREKEKFAEVLSRLYFFAKF